MLSNYTNKTHSTYASWSSALLKLAFIYEMYQTWGEYGGGVSYEGEGPAGHGSAGCRMTGQEISHLNAQAAVRARIMNTGHRVLWKLQLPLREHGPVCVLPRSLRARDQMSCHAPVHHKTRRMHVQMSVCIYNSTTNTLCTISDGSKVYRRIKGSQFTHCSGIAVRTSATSSTTCSGGQACNTSSMYASSWTNNHKLSISSCPMRMCRSLTSFGL